MTTADTTATMPAPARDRVVRRRPFVVRNARLLLFSTETPFGGSGGRVAVAVGVGVAVAVGVDA